MLTTEQLDLVRRLAGAHALGELPLSVVQALAVSIRNYQSDPFGRSLDWHLGLPPRQSRLGIRPRTAVAENYRRLARELPCRAKNAKAEAICSETELFAGGVYSQIALEAPYRDFFREHFEIRQAFLGESSIRQLLS